MTSKKRIFSIIVGSIFMFLLILDPDTAMKGATIGIEQCIHVIIPSLFPFFFITVYLNSWLLGLRIPGLHFIADLLRIPKGGDSILLLGLIGGYPVGAQTITGAYQRGSITRDCAHILLGYCNNAGPAFIFGVTSCLFTSAYIPWLLWLVQLFAIIITGLLLPRPDSRPIAWNNNSGITAVTAMQNSIRSIGSVCGWILLFKILLTFISKVLHQLSNSNFRILLAGILELSNGCIELTNVATESVRFVFCSVFLAFGGICVLMQTHSAAGSLGLGYYLPGKIIQTSLSFLISLPLSYLLFSDIVPDFRLTIPAIFACICIIFLTMHCRRKKLWQFITI